MVLTHPRIGHRSTLSFRSKIFREKNEIFQRTKTDYVSQISSLFISIAVKSYLAQSTSRCYVFCEFWRLLQKVFLITNLTVPLIHQANNNKAEVERAVMTRPRLGNSTLPWSCIGKLKLCFSQTMELKSIVFTLLVVQVSSFITKFCERLPQPEQKFHPLRHCQRSNKTVIAYSSVSSVDECADFTRKFRGLAFNFSPPSRFKFNLFGRKNVSQAPDNDDDDDKRYNCQVLECPEHKNFSSIVNDTRFDHFSLYTHPPRETTFLFTCPHDRKLSIPAGPNTSCIPSVGMFVLIETKSNYSVAYNVCSSLGGSLAHVASETRTFMLSQFLEQSANSSSTEEQFAFVGLNETSRNEFFTSANEPLRCFSFRAWAPGHPPSIRKSGCVAITSNSTWKVLSCNRRVKFVCEIFTSGPNPHVNNIREKCRIDKPNNRFKPQKSAAK